MQTSLAALEDEMSTTSARLDDKARLLAKAEDQLKLLHVQAKVNHLTLTMLPKLRGSMHQNNTNTSFVK